MSRNAKKKGDIARCDGLVLTVGVPHGADELHFGRAAGVVDWEAQLGLEVATLK